MMPKILIRAAKIWLPSGGILLVWWALTGNPLPVILLFPTMFVCLLVIIFGKD